MEANFGGECSLSVSLSVSLSLCVFSLSLSLSRVQREKQTNNSSNNNNGNNTKRERVTKEFVFSDVCLFSTFSEPPQKETRSTLYIIIALLPCFCSSSSLPPLKEESVSEAYSSLRARVLYPFIKSSGNICESAQKAVRGFVYVADLSV